LKIAIISNHDSFRFEVWLAGFNKQVQQTYRKLFKESNWNRYHIVITTKGDDAIFAYPIVDNPDFSNLYTLTKIIEGETLEFISGFEISLKKSKLTLRDLLTQTNRTPRSRVFPITATAIRQEII
jgi:hypothetical protein